MAKVICVREFKNVTCFTYDDGSVVVTGKLVCDLPLRTMQQRMGEPHRREDFAEGELPSTDRGDDSERSDEVWQ